MSDEKKNKKTKWILTGVAVFACLILTPLATECIVSRYYPPAASDGETTVDPLARAGTFGDQYGSLNALFSGGALLFAAMAIYYQTQEMKQTNLEMKQQTAQAANNAKINALTSLTQHHETLVAAFRERDQQSKVGPERSWNRIRQSEHRGYATGYSLQMEILMDGLTGEEKTWNRANHFPADRLGDVKRKYRTIAETETVSTLEPAQDADVEKGNIFMLTETCAMLWTFTPIDSEAHRQLSELIRVANKAWRDGLKEVGDSDISASKILKEGYQTAATILMRVHPPTHITDDSASK